MSEDTPTPNVEPTPPHHTGTIPVVTVPDKEKYGLTRFTKIFIGAAVGLVALVLVFYITFITVNLQHARADNLDLRQRNTTLLTNYNNLYKEFEKATDKKPDSPTPTQVSRTAGPQGPAGITGAQGATGVNGASGAQGAEGAQGADGATGAAGNAGTNGANGKDGAAGSAGATGASGSDGQNGAQGATGATGSTGATGDKGDKGDTGDMGAQGLQGVQGPEGPAGPQGPPGETCPAGTSFTQITVQELLGTQTFYACQ